jgi:hypothetical protein
VGLTTSSKYYDFNLTSLCKVCFFNLGLYFFTSNFSV